MLLASGEMGQDLAASLVFGRDLARRFFAAVCHLGEEGFDQWHSIPPPAEEQLAEMVAEAPPMRGLEYLTVAVLRDLWAELRELVVARAAAFSDGPSAYLRTINPLWPLLDRLPFHLPEQQPAPPNPFALFTTFTTH